MSLEDLLGPFFQNHWRERAECLPVLHPPVQLVLHLGSAWVRQDAAVAESTRSEFGATLKPAEHIAFGQQSCRFTADLVAAAALRLEANRHFVHGGMHLLVLV